MAFYRLERLMNLYDGYQRAFTINGQSWLLIQDNGRTFLIANQCPHQQAPLDRSTLQQGVLRCPAHGMRFELATGKGVDGCKQPLTFKALAYEGNQVGVDV